MSREITSIKIGTIASQVISIQKYPQIFTVRLVNNVPYLYAIVNTEGEHVQMTIRTFKTGENFDVDGVHHNYLGTYYYLGEWHVFAVDNH